MNNPMDVINTNRCRGFSIVGILGIQNYPRKKMEIFTQGGNDFSNGHNGVLYRMGYVHDLGCGEDYSVGGAEWEY